jgi:eukaryotic-like serine/threonine-protein kinase
MADRHQNEKSLFLAALEIDSDAERAAFLKKACEGDPQLQAEVDALLQAHAKSQPILDATPSPDPAVDQPTADRSGAVIGPYKLIEQIGEGGMGIVWMAQQTEPVKRLVALKLIKAGMDSKLVIARFEAERQALALMDHANICRVLDAGATSAGRPYFVMDLIKGGVPITRYCDEHRLTPRQRLELFLPVCHAIQHAHQKGVIHRDLKPSNVLVALYDGKPVPKVIDFGVAKATEQNLTDKTLITGFGAIVGTLEYMSPEQAEINQLDIDTRSDIYSLGVLLYELLAGSPPFTRKDLEKAGMMEMLRVIREQEPSKPSTKLSTAEGLPSLAANRGTEPAKLTKLVRGELDWIVMKALEKDRNRRYETANGFAMDVQRYLADEPVAACPPSAMYRVRKFARRNKGPVLAAAAILFVLLAGIAGTTFGLLRAEHRRAAAERAEEDTLAEFRASTDEVVEQLIGSKPNLGPQERAYLEKTLKRWQTFAARQGDDERSQSIRAEGHQRVASLWHKLGQRDAALEHYNTACDLFGKLVDAFPQRARYLQGLAHTHSNFAVLLSGSGQGDAARSENEKARHLQKKLVASFPDVPKYQQALSRTHNNLGSLLRQLGRNDAARTEYETARELREKLCAAFPDNFDYQQELTNTRGNLATLLRLMDQRDAARSEFEAVRDLQLKLAAKFPDEPEYQQALARTHNNLALLLRDLGQRDAALKEYESACESQRKLAESFPAVSRYQVELGGYYCNIGNLRRDDGRSADSLQWFDLAIHSLTPLYEQDRRDAVAKRFLRNSHYGRAQAYDKLKKYAAANDDWDRAVELSAESEQPRYRRGRAVARLRTGKIAGAVGDADELTRTSEWSANDFYTFACIYAAASGEIADKKQLYADRALDFLRQSVKAGYKDAAQLSKERYLASLRERDDFQKLIAELKTKNK